MPDQSYKDQNFVFGSKGVAARRVDDTYEPGFWLNEGNCEELAENSIANRLGTIIVNRLGTAIQPLAGVVHSLAKLSSLNGQAYRYAGAGPFLYRRPAAGQGAYTQISDKFSGSPWQFQTYGSTDFTSLPYIFFADDAGMFKDNGTLDNPQQMGIFQPPFPVRAQAQAPAVIPLDPAPGNTYSATGITGLATNVATNPTTTLSSAVTVPGIQAVTVTNVPNQMALFQYVTVGSEKVLVIGVTTNGFIANFTTTHSVGEAVTGMGMTGGVTSQGNVNVDFTGRPIAAFPGTLQQADYISLQLFISDPTDIQQVILKFDCGDGSFSGDYFYKVIAQGPLQNLLNTASQPEAAATDAIVSESIGVYGNNAGNIAQLNVGMNTVTQLLMQLSDFAGSGRADFNDPTYNWQNVNGYQITLVTNNNASETVTFEVSSVVLFGGAGPDSFAGVGYDYLFTLYNGSDGTESNPCMVMSNVNPPLNTNFVYPRRQPVLLTINLQNIGDPDPQVTFIRIYRRGGTLGDNYRRVDTVQVYFTAGGTVQYLDTAADIDIQSNDFISFTNDVPVTSSLPVPVNTTLISALVPGTAGLVLTIKPASMQGISLRQQVSLGVLGGIANTFETVIVLGVGAATFTAFVQNPHAANEPVTATAQYGVPVSIMKQAFGMFLFAGDKNNPHYMYYAPANNPQYVSSAAWIAVGSPDDPIVDIEEWNGNIYVGTAKFWWSVAPGSLQSGQNGGSTAPYPTKAKHGPVSRTGVVVTEEAIFYQAIDGIRAFEGGASDYLTQDQEFIWQGIGSSPIVEANLAALNQTAMEYWNSMIFACYTGVDGQRHRMIYHQIYKRWRNDDVYADSILLEADTNTLVYGDADGLVHIDRQNQAYDESGTVQLVKSPIIMNLQSPYTDQGQPSITKSYQELTLDINTNGETLMVVLYFDDGEASFFIGTVSTTVRQKVNFTLNSGLGFEYYKVSAQLLGGVTKFTYIFQWSLKALPLAKTRTSFDSFWLKQGTDESKVAKNVWIEYTSTQDVDFAVYYDGAVVPGKIFTLKSTGGFRKVVRTRLPAIAYRLIRIVGLSPQNFQVWNDSKIEWKTVGTGKGWEITVLISND